MALHQHQTTMRFVNLVDMLNQYWPGSLASKDDQASIIFTSAHNWRTKGLTQKISRCIKTSFVPSFLV